MSVDELIALRRCEGVVHAFYRALDDGDLDLAFAHHADDLEFFPPGSDAPLGLKASKTDAERVRNAYPGRRTLHLATAFEGDLVESGIVEATYLMTVYELTERSADGAVDRAEPIVFALARERCTFREEGGTWLYTRQVMEPIAPRRPAWSAS